MRKFFFIFWLSAFAMLLNAQQLTYTSRAIGNSTHMGKGPHMQNHIGDMVVEGDGTCKTYSVWDEGSHSMGVYKDGAFLYNGNLPQGSSRSVVDNNGKTWTINNFYGRFLDATKNSYPSFRTDPVPTGSNKPTITCSDGRTITSIADPTALGINRNNGQLLVADNGTDQNIKVFNISGTPSQVSTFGKQGGVWGDPIPGRTSDMLRFRGITGVGGDNSGNIYVAQDGYAGIEGGGGGAEIRAFNPDGTLRWRMVGFIFVSTGHVDPSTDGADIYTSHHHFKMDYSKPQGFNSDWSQYSISINPFLYPNDPRLVISTEDPQAIKIINGKKYMFLTDMYHNMLWVYRFDGEIAVPCASFCVHFGWNGDEYIRNSWNHTRGRPAITANGQHWLWTDLNGDGSGENQSNEYAFFNVSRFMKGVDIDNDGNVYLASADNGNIYKFPTNGFDSNGNPRYSAASMSVFANVGHGAYSTKWVQENDMFVCGNGEDITTVDIWQNWSSPSRSKVRSVTMPAHPEGDARSVTADQDYFYMNYLLAGGPKTGKQGEIDVYKMSDGSFVGYIIPGPEIGSVSGQNDMASPVNVFVTSTGKRLVINQEDEVGKVLVYEWTPSGSTPSQSPYGGTARAIPGTIQAEDFDTGGQGIAYSDSGTANEGGQYRTTEGVDIEVCAEGGYDIGWVNAGEWMEYTVNATAGTYNISLRVSSPNSNKQAKVYLDGTLLGTFTVPNTGSWQTWQTVTVNNVAISGGNGKILKIECVTDGFNVNWVQFTAATVAVTSVSVSPTTASLNVSATQQLTATVLPANATNKTVSWSSSNTSVATVNSSGLVTGIAAGSATITVTTQDGARTATCAVTVTAGAGNLALNKTTTASSSEGAGFEASKTVDGSLSTRWASGMNDPNPEWIYVDLGSSYSITRVKLTWEAAYGRSYQIQVSSNASTWTDIYTTTTGDGGVDDLTSLSGTGRYVRVYATQRGLGGGFSLYEYEVYGTSNIAVTSVSVSPTTASLNVSATQQLTATVLPANATNKTVSWSSSNTSVATVNSSGLVTGIAAGSATITVTTQDGAIAATCAVTVTAAGTGNLALNKTTTSSSSEGAGFEASKAVDGSLSTRWASGMNDPNPEWVYVDLGASYSITRVKLTWEAAYGRSYQIQISPDASTWTTIYTTTTGDGGVDDLTNLSGTGRYVRLYATQRGLGGGFSLYEFEVYGTIVATKYEAENAVLNGVSVATNHSGFSGTGFAAGFGGTGNYVQFSIVGATAGSQDVDFGYSNANGSARTLSLYVNGTKVRQVSFPNIGSWDSWADKVENVTLTTGNNTIKLQRDGDDSGQLNIDYLSFGNGLQSVKKQFEVSNDAFDNDLNVKVYPNPLTKGILVVELLKEGTSVVTMYSITGKEIFNTTVTNANKLHLPREQFNEGMYILNVRSGNEVNNVKIIVK